MQINFDPRDLTPQQRSHVAAFLTEWPVAKHKDFDLTKFSRNVGKSNALAEGASAAGVALTARTELVPQTEPERLANENAADLQPLDAADDNTDKAAAQAAFTPSATPDRDGEGLPWDRRIHSSSKALNADGRWRIARNVAPELIESVKAELRALVAAPVTVEHAGVTTQSDAAQQAVVPPPPPVVVSIDPAAPGTDLNVMYTTLLRDAAQAVVAQRIKSADLTAICAKHGVANVGLLASRKDLVPQIDADFRALRAVLASQVQS